LLVGCEAGERGGNGGSGGADLEGRGYKGDEGLGGGVMCTELPGAVHVTVDKSQRNVSWAMITSTE